MGIAPTGKQVTYTALCIYIVVGGKMSEAWVEFDQMGLMQQLGAATKPGSYSAQEV
jgi:predicted ester cyclase